MEKILILAYPGTGKTYLADNYKNVIDLEFQHYRFDYGKYKSLPLEKLKGRTDLRTERLGWKKSFFEYLEKELEKDRIVLVPFATSLLEILDHLQDKGVRIIFAIQDKNDLDFLLETFRKRGNSEKFIERRNNDFIKMHNIIEKLNFETIIIAKGKYLRNSLIENGIKLIQGKGFKNYL